MSKLTEREQELAFAVAVGMVARGKEMTAPPEVKELLNPFLDAVVAQATELQEQYEAAKDEWDAASILGASFAAVFATEDIIKAAIEGLVESIREQTKRDEAAYEN